MKIYTKKGDKGLTSLIGEKTTKSDPRIHVIGLLDRVLVKLGRLMSSDTELENLEQIYKTLFKIQSMVADVEDSLNFSISVNHINELEEWIDILEEELEPLKNFIYYLGGEDFFTTQEIRVDIREVERYLFEIEGIQVNALAYINRLSDYFFVLSRYINKINNVKDKIIKING